MPEQIPGFPGAPTIFGNESPNRLSNILSTALTVVNRINSGKINVVLDVTLAANEASTVVADARLTRFSGVHFDPMTANAAAEIAAGSMYVPIAGRKNGEWTITHANNAQTDRQYRMVVLG